MKNDFEIIIVEDNPNDTELMLCSLKKNRLANNRRLLMKQLRLFVIVVICLYALFVILPEIGFAQTEKLRRVLVINSYHSGFEWTESIVSGIRSEFEKTNSDIKLTLEYMDTKNYDPAVIFPYLKDLYQLKYQKARFDVIITTDNNAFNFLLMNRNQLFPGVPIVFTAFNNFSDSLIAGYTGITGVVEDFDIKGTLDLALRLHPGTENVAVISDTTPTDAATRERFEQIKPEFEERINFIDLAGLSAAELQITLTQLPKNTVILLFNLYRLAQGDVFTLEEGVTLVSESSSLPIYSMWEDRVKIGILGGIIISGEMQGQYAAKMAIRIMNGETPADIPILQESPNIPMFNYTQLQRFGLALSDLPEGSVVFNKPDTFYSRYKNYILGVLIFGSILILIIIALLISITRRKQAEKALREAHDQLEDKVAQRTKELENANKELDAFAYSVSHDLRGPLRAISGFTRILMEDYVENLDAEGKRLGEIIQKNTQKMAQLIDDLLNFSRMGRTVMKFSKINMKEMATAIYHEVTDVKARKRITFSLADLPEVKGDTTMMRQVWANLISNAIKFSTNREQAVILVSCQEKENKLIYCIKDNGAGFNMKYKDKLFGVFQRLHSEKEFEGTGVGLALVQRIIYRHGGEVWAEGEVDNGAAFYFSLLKKIGEY